MPRFKFTITGEADCESVEVANDLENELSAVIDLEEIQVIVEEVKDETTT